MTSGEEVQTYPDPRVHCDICRWSRQCDARRRSDDHLSLVAGISNLHAAELKAKEVDTVARLAGVALPWPWKPDRGAVATYEKIREQARVQMEGRTADVPIYETLDQQPGLGLAKLPEPSPGDVFFDIEGDPFVGPGGLEFLFGYVTVDESGDLPHTGFWALDYEEEKRCFERFVDWLVERWARHEDMHVYHYAPYEPSAMKRLMSRHATREAEVDRMLRAGLFVDLYRVTRESVRASVESYSIKNLEPFFDFRREVFLGDANRALYAVSAALESGGAKEIENSALTTVEEYNRDDCASTFHLRGWLEGIRLNLMAQGLSIERRQIGHGEASERLTDWEQAIRELADRIAHGVPAAPDERSEEQQARWVLANILEWHRREDKAAWWEYFRLRDTAVEDLLDDRAALARLEMVGTVGGTAKAPVHRYRFPAQETSLRGGETLHVPGEQSPLGSLVALDTLGCTIDVKKRGASANNHPEAVFAHDIVPSQELKNALVRVGEHVAAHGMADDGKYRAARDLLLRRPPRLNGAPVQRQSESALDAALRIASDTDFSVLPVQGPPRRRKDLHRRKDDMRIREQWRSGGDHRQQPQGDRQPAAGGAFRRRSARHHCQSRAEDLPQFGRRTTRPACRPDDRQLGRFRGIGRGLPSRSRHRLAMGPGRGAGQRRRVVRRRGRSDVAGERAGNIPRGAQPGAFGRPAAVGPTRSGHAP